MSDTHNGLFETFVLDRPWLVFAVVAAVLAAAVWFGQRFHLDVSAESLVLENDADLEYYRKVTERYGSDDYLIVTFSPAADLFAAPSLATLRALRDELSALERVSTVVSLLDVPLLQSPPVTIAGLGEALPTLESAAVDRVAARHELLTSPLYRNRLISPDGTTTAIQVNFARDETYWALLTERDRLRDQHRVRGTQAPALAAASSAFEKYNAIFIARQEQDIARVREILGRYRADAEIYLGGIPMITTDMMQFIRHDIAVFGVSVVAILGVALAWAFRGVRWVFIAFGIALSSSVFSVGIIGLLGWPVTVVSSNFLSLILIFSVSLAVHLIVRYQELHELNPTTAQRELVARTMRSKAAPCLYTVVTTMVAFASLVLSDIRPVIDFGWMMAIALASAFVFAFTLFPAALVVLDKSAPRRSGRLTGAITDTFARLADRFPLAVLFAGALTVVAGVLGMRQLTVENRFIDYFHESTEIYQGMLLIDEKLGGTTPLDVIIDAPPDIAVAEETGDELFPDLFDETDANAITTTSHWFNTYHLRDVAVVHDYLDGLADTGKVLSLHTAMSTLDKLDEDGMLDDFFLSLLYKRLPDDVKAQMVSPYFSEELDQLRFSIRVRESDPALQREALIESIRDHLTGLPELDGATVSLSGMLVLYNNLLQSLFRSQILTLGAVFVAIIIAFAVLFRSLLVAAVAIVPNLLAAGLVLGVMGWLAIPLDIMTITIAAITVGIAVDDTIHYIHRHRLEWEKDHDYRAAMFRSHASIGRAMYYTTFTITIGFLVLAVSNFVPTALFGLLTGFAMVTALVCDLLVLPVLLSVVKPYGR